MMMMMMMMMMTMTMMRMMRMMISKRTITELFFSPRAARAQRQTPGSQGPGASRRPGASRNRHRPSSASSLSSICPNTGARCHSRVLVKREYRKPPFHPSWHLHDYHEPRSVCPVYYAWAHSAHATRVQSDGWCTSAQTPQCVTNSTQKYDEI